MNQWKQMTDTFTLLNDVKIPCVGFGTWEIEEGEVVETAVQQALDAGFRHIDTATAYGNEKGVGRGIAASDVDREDIFVTTKLWNDSHGYQSTLDAFERSLEMLGLDYLDLYLVHWPNPKKFRDSFEETNAETWRAMEEIYRSGKARSIGVSNYLPHHLDSLFKTAEISPMVNQIRLYPGYLQPEVIDYCTQRNILLQAYSPLGRGEVLAAKEIKEIAKAHGKTPAQVCLRGSLQKGFLPLPKSQTKQYIEENTQLFDFSLTDEEMDVLSRMPNYGGDGGNPDTVDF